MNGFVTLGKAELLLTFGTVAVLMTLLGVGLGQIWLMARRPAVVKPEPCPRLHCETEEELNAWLRRCDYSLITNEVLSTLDLSKPRGRHRAPSPLQHWRDEAEPPPLWWDRKPDGRLTPGPRPPSQGPADAPGIEIVDRLWPTAPSPADTRSTDRWPTEDQG